MNFIQRVGLHAVVLIIEIVESKLYICLAVVIKRICVEVDYSKANCKKPMVFIIILLLLFTKRNAICIALTNRILTS